MARDLVTVSEACEIIDGLTKNKVDWYVSRGYVKPVKTVLVADARGWRRPLYDLEELEDTMLAFGYRKKHAPRPADDARAVERVIGEGVSVRSVCDGRPMEYRVSKILEARGYRWRKKRGWCKG